MKIKHYINLKRAFLTQLFIVFVLFGFTQNTTELFEKSKTNSRGNFTEYEVMKSSFDLQSNAGITNRIAAWEDGSIANVATFMPGDKDPWTQASSYRGTGYNYFDGNSFGEQPESRIENIRTGWPSIAPYGVNGEIMVAHTGSGLVCYTRENKGYGSLTGPQYIPNPNGHPSIDQSASFELSWPRVATCGTNHNVINIVSATQNSIGSGDNTIYEYNTFLTRSTDGVNWTTTKMPALANNALNQCSADDYAMAANGNNIAVLFTSSYNEGGGDNHTTDVVLLKSTNGGETWAKTTVWKAPIEGDWLNPSIFDTINHDILYLPVMGSVAMDNNGIAHVALTAETVKCGNGDGTYSYFFGIMADGVFYWKEGDAPFITGPVRPDGTSDT